MNIAVFGLGRVGSPLALYIASRNHRVYGYDIDPDRRLSLNQKKFPFMEQGAQELLDKHLNTQFFVADSASAAMDQVDAIIITVGTPVDAYMNPNFKQIETVFSSIYQLLKPGQLIILRSTLAPGTTEYLQHSLEQNTKYQIGKDIFLAYCPERTAEGKTIEEMPHIPQLIGSLDKASATKAQKLFDTLSPEVLISDSRSVEIAKLICNMYRYINFALGNELMMIANQHQRDIYEIVNLVNHHYQRGGVAAPGFSAGPCLFKDGFFLIKNIPYTELISTSWSINERMPNYLIDNLSHQISLAGKKVAVLGLAFKKNSDDPRDSLSYKLIKLLEHHQAIVTAHDPYIASASLAQATKDSQIIILATNHDYYKKYSLSQIKKMTGRKQVYICDIWNLFKQGQIIYKI